MFVLQLAFDEDNAARLAARPAHRDYLKRLEEEGRLVSAGPWKDDSGALLVFRTDKAGMDEIMATDAYYATPGVRVVSLHEWTPIAGSAR